MKSKLKDFEGVNPWYLERVCSRELQRASIVDQVIDVNYTLEDMPDKLQKDTGKKLKETLLQKGRAVILCSVIRGNGMHQIVIGAKMDGDRVRLTYMDSSGDKCKTNAVQSIKGIIENADLEGRVDFSTSIPIQQRIENQPNTCVFWSLKNAEDFIKNKEIKGFDDVEADRQIEPYLKRYYEQTKKPKLENTT